MTAREKVIIHTLGVAIGCELLITRALQQHGFVSVRNGQVEVAKASEDLARFMKIKLDALRLLPVARRAKVVTSLSEYLAGNGAGADGHENRPQEQDIPSSSPTEEE